ncbi:MAG: DivIVA domain-containing protein [Frankia sp.]
MSVDRPTFDEVARGYDPRQVDEYLGALWRYASEVTGRAAAAEAALDQERRYHAQNAGASGGEAGARIGMMLNLAQQEADQMTGVARRIAERALEEAVDDAASNNPIVSQAQDQADRILVDAFEEAERRAKAREDEVTSQLSHSTARLEAIRHQQGEILGALLRLRGLLTSDEIDRSLADLARAATAEGGPVNTPPHGMPHPQGQSHPRTAAHPSAGQPPPQSPPQPQGPPPQTPPPQHGQQSPHQNPHAPRRPPPPPPPRRHPGPPGPIGAEDDIIDAEVVEE